MESTPRAVERKVVTALFCDVVGSTELGERLDPEDIDRVMGAYHRLARRRVETNGGSVEKFIGDAVVGVFGAPIVHEDDPARAIRAALGIIADLESSGLDLQVRIGIQSGLAVVRVGDDRTAEEGLATGDILNTAARLQNATSPGGIAVGEPTYQRTKAEFVWEDLGEVPLKGKALPVHVWRPTDERQTPASDTGEATEFVGRDRELARLLEVFERAAAEQRMEVVTIVAEAGLGKSRLVRELAWRVQAKGVLWRKGRCLPYGDGISFWALAEIVKSSAGIVESDDQPAIRRKLDSVIAEPDPDRHTCMPSSLPHSSPNRACQPPTRHSTKMPFQPRSRRCWPLASMRCPATSSRPSWMRRSSGAPSGWAPSQAWRTRNRRRSRRDLSTLPGASSPARSCHPPWRARLNTGSGTRCSEMSPTRSCHEPRESRSTAPPRPGSRHEPGARSVSSQRSWRTTSGARSIWRRRRPRTRCR